MGIDKMSIAANYHNQAVQATQINKVNVQTSSDTAAKEMTADSKVSTASTVQITNTQKSGTDNGESNLAQQNEKKEASIKELKDIQKVINRNTIAEFGYNEPTTVLLLRLKIRTLMKSSRRYHQRRLLKCLQKPGSLLVSLLMRRDRR